jgi:hypothetical protein
MQRKIIAASVLGVACLAAGALSVSATAADRTMSAISAPAQDTPEPTDTTAAPNGEPTSDRPEPGARLAETLAPLVADGTLTQAQADAVVSTLIEARPEGPGRGGEGRGRSGPSLDAAATALGLSVEDLRAQLRDGSTLAEIATVQGVDVATVVDALVAEATTRLNEAVTAGRLTQEEADAKLVDIEARITEFVNEGGHRDGHRGGGQLKD